MGLNINGGDFVAIKQINLSAIPKEEVGGIMVGGERLRSLTYRLTARPPQTEIDLLKKLRHDNIVKYIGYSKTKEYLNIVLE